MYIELQAYVGVLVFFFYYFFGGESLAANKEGSRLPGYEAFSRNLIYTCIALKKNVIIIKNNNK